MAYVREMARDELVAELRDMVLSGAVCHHQTGDPTILGAPRLRELLIRLRIAVLAGFVCKRPH